MTINNAGSKWLRWEPHIHVPGTLFNDQFGGDDALEQYLQRLESATPMIRALGVTDYYVTDSYEKIRAAKAAGRIKDCDLIFPNIELRLGVGTMKMNWVNIHLLVDPSDNDHLDELERFLGQLQFKMPGQVYRCTKSDLRRLGKEQKPELTSVALQIEEGGRQFKVDFDELKTTYEHNAWAQANMLIAIAGGDDGIGGVRDANDTALRRKIASFAHVVFAASDAQREFWLGGKSASEEELEASYNGLKPCLHGSDAHELEKVGKPDHDRYCWVKGVPTFDAIHQATISPRTRAFVGPRPPGGAGENRVISHIKLNDAPWFRTPEIDFNPGLVAIIGARGSGKTALADILAKGCDAEIEAKDQSSFLSRARPFLGDAAGEIRWQSGETDEFFLRSSTAETAFAPMRRVRYLSQKFVEKLCSAEGMTDALLKEIEAIIFRAHSAGDAEFVADFQELRDISVSQLHHQRAVNAGLIETIATQVATEQGKRSAIPRYEKEIGDKQRLVNAYETERGKHVVKGREAETKRIIELTGHVDNLKVRLRNNFTKQETIEGLMTKVKTLRTSEAPDALRLLRDEYRLAGLPEESWQRFLLNYTGNVDATLMAERDKSVALQNELIGDEIAAGDPNRVVIAAEADLSKQTLNRLKAEIRRLQDLINVDQETAKRFKDANDKVAKENRDLAALRESLIDAQGAAARINALQSSRDDAYKAVFETIVGEEQVLNTLYTPLLQRLEAAPKTLGKLRFKVERVVDVRAWALAGEEFLDLRRTGEFKGEGALYQHANTLLRTAWETGTADEVLAAMISFRSAHHSELMSHSKKYESDKPALLAWLKRLSSWVYSTDHVTLRYGLYYDGIEITSLSPGTRGIVLLLLYLALDDTDDTPLIIDQPEENLDPKSIHDELVDLFVETRKRRQVIMVTHNANLVVNTDADQVIVASCGPRENEGLPPITYVTGGLEEAHIRKMVCDTLEGGERAFKERARRLRIKVQRA